QTIASTVVNGGSAAFTIRAEGTTTITFFGTDNVGNVETPRSQVIKLDSRPPFIRVSGEILTSHHEDDQRAVHVAIWGKISDLISGVDPSSAKFIVSNEDGITQTSGQLALASDGTYSVTVSFKQTHRDGQDHEEHRERRQYKVTVSAIDNAGNVGSSSSIIT